MVAKYTLVMSAGPSEGHQGMAYYPALRHAQDVSEVSPLSDRTQQVVHWRCSRVPIVPASADMQASDVEAVDTAHHCVWCMVHCVTIHCIVAYIYYYILCIQAKVKGSGKILGVALIPLGSCQLLRTTNAFYPGSRSFKHTILTYCFGTPFSLMHLQTS